MFGFFKGIGHTPQTQPPLENRGARLGETNKQSDELKNSAATFAQIASELNTKITGKSEKAGKAEKNKYTQKAKRGNRGKAFHRKTEEVNAERAPQPGKVEIGGKDLSKRKIVWLEKFKHHLNIFACKVSLKLHFYRGQEARAALKKSRDESKSELAILTNEEAMKTNTSKMKEELEDRQYLKAAKRAVATSEAAFKAGKGRIESWWARV
ncbi:hypothetical protein J7438_00535 [Thalassotalea sp. G20_0]|uniref:hypothetical protein n=1 Tax=Thalassotalea sp. G20_0 TaxID=2821093 RepID=UPI001ADB7BBC|nr:hypothetical protein [Thalassotalea sp. G20_0]MBO9492584.1 hypothetical protein [Thalassotalea sp. G20_0]